MSAAAHTRVHPPSAHTECTPRTRDALPLTAARSPPSLPPAPRASRRDISEAEREEPDQEYNVANWDFVSPTAVVEEYMENMYQCVSAI